MAWPRIRRFRRNRCPFHLSSSSFSGVEAGSPPRAACNFSAGSKQKQFSCLTGECIRMADPRPAQCFLRFLSAESCVVGGVLLLLDNALGPCKTSPIPYPPAPRPARRRRARDACEFSVLPELLFRKSFLSHFSSTPFPTPLPGFRATSFLHPWRGRSNPLHPPLPFRRRIS